MQIITVCVCGLRVSGNMNCVRVWTEGVGEHELCVCVFGLRVSGNMNCMRVWTEGVGEHELCACVDRKCQET